MILLYSYSLHITVNTTVKMISPLQCGITLEMEFHCERDRPLAYNQPQNSLHLAFDDITFIYYLKI